MERRRLRLGLIGTGSIATSAHLPAIAALPDLVELVAVADIRTEIAEAVGRSAGAFVHADFRDLLARDDIDAVDICTPEFLHADQVVAAAEAGKHVLCEKPIAASLADADAMIAACERAGVTLMVAHSRRFTPRYRRMHAALARIGEVRFFRENERRPSAFPSAPDDAVPVWTPPSGKVTALPWTRDAAYTRGAAMTNAVHEMDLMRWFIGREPEAVFAESRIADPAASTPDVISILVRFEGGATGATEIVNRLPPDHPVYHMTEVVGTSGTLRALDDELAPVSVTTAGTTTRPGNWGTLLHVHAAYVEELRAFAEAVLAESAAPLAPRAARQAIAMSLAAVESSETGQWIEVAR